MNDKEIFLAGFTAARTRGTPTAELSGISQRTAERLFERWIDQNG